MKVSPADPIYYSSLKAGSIIEYDPKGPMPSSVPAMVWSSGPWGTNAVVTEPIWMYRPLGKRKETPTLVVPSLRWECAGMYTVYVLCCYGAYLIAAI